MKAAPQTPAMSVPAPLLEAVDDALSLLEQHSGYWRPTEIGEEALPSLLEQCQRISAEALAREPEPIRTIHHFACTGGTLFSKYLAATANTQVLSEIDPLSTIPMHRFSPSDLILQLRYSAHGVSDALLLDIFTAGLQVLYEHSCKFGERLVLRDHSHSHFCTAQEIGKRPTLLQIVQEHHPVLSVVTVRHPLDSFLSLTAGGWLHFSPATLNEYAHRYQLFLDAYADLPIFKYEELTTSPLEVQEKLCAELQLPFDQDTYELMSAISLTGDSGRSSGVIGQRERRPIPEAVALERQSSAHYILLCQRLGYEP